jgi:hypothetical protein
MVEFKETLMLEIMLEYKWSRREKQVLLLKDMPYKWRSSGKQLYAENSRKTRCARRSGFGYNICECLSSLRNPFNSGGKPWFTGRGELAGRRQFSGRSKLAGGGKLTDRKKLKDRRKFADRKFTGRRKPCGGYFTCNTGRKPLRQFAGWMNFAGRMHFAGGCRLNKTITGDVS